MTTPWCKEVSNAQEKPCTTRFAICARTEGLYVEIIAPAFAGFVWVVLGVRPEPGGTALRSRRRDQLSRSNSIK